MLTKDCEREGGPDRSSSCFGGFGLDPFGGALAKAFMMLPEVLRFIVVVDAFAVSVVLTILAYQKLLVCTAS